MALGIPAICNDGVGDTSKIVSEYSSGITIEAVDTHGFAAAIDSIDKMKFDSKKIRKGALDYFSLGKGISAYENVYQTVLSKKQ